MLNHLLKSLPKYRSFLLMGAVQRAQNYKLLIGLSFLMVTCLLIFAYLWDAASSRVNTPTFTPTQLLWYLAFNEWMLISIPEIEIDIEQDLRSGRLAYLLTRPVSYIGSKIAEGVGILLVQLIVLGLVGFIFTYAWTGELPFSLPFMIISLVLGLMAGFLGVMIQVVIGLSAFWIHEVGPIQWIFQKFLFVFGGLFLPLVAYPLWIQDIASLTPFPLLLGGRSALVFNPTWMEVGSLSMAIIAWLAITSLFMGFLYKKGLKIVNIEGG